MDRAWKWSQCGSSTREGENTAKAKVMGFGIWQTWKARRRLTSQRRRERINNWSSSKVSALRKMRSEAQSQEKACCRIHSLDQAEGQLGQQAFQVTGSSAHFEDRPWSPDLQHHGLCPHYSSSKLIFPLIVKIARVWKVIFFSLQLGLSSLSFGIQIVTIFKIISFKENWIAKPS